MPMFHRFKKRDSVLVVGTFRSGTNLMKWMLESHYGTEVHFSRWFGKHGLPPTSILRPIPDDVPIVVMTKDPVKLNASLYSFWQKRRPELSVGDNFEDFITQPLVVYDNTDGQLRPQYRFATPTDYWNQYHFSWTHWREVSARLNFVKLEDLLADPVLVMDSLEARLDLAAPLTRERLLPDQPVLPSSDGKAATIRNSRTGFVPAKPLVPSAHEASIIRSLVDRDTALALQYLDYL